MADAAQQLQVTFVTKHRAFAVPTVPIAIPTTLNPKGLNDVINHLRASSDKQKFQFTVNGTLLRSTIAKYLASSGTSEELQLEIEYAPELPGPSLTSQHESPDWISAIAGATPGYFFSACYDGSIRSFSASGEVVDSFRAHAKPLASIAVHTSATDATSHTVVTGSKDQRIRAWNVSTGSKASHTAIFDGLGHGSSVQAVSIARHGRQCVSGGWDGSLLVWDLPRSAEQARQSAGYVEVDDSAAGGDGGGKRQRGGGAADVSAGTDNKTPSFQPITRLTGHKQAVGGVQWVSDREVVTGSWDHSVCLWDLSRGGEPVQTLHGSKVVTSITCQPHTADATVYTVATGHPDRVVRLWDLRAAGSSSSGTVVKMVIPKLSGWVSDVAWCPGAEHILAAACQDGSVPLYDIRSPASPLHVVTTHKQKALAVAWAAPDEAAGSAGQWLLASGGADQKIKIHTVHV